MDIDLLTLEELYDNFCRFVSNTDAQDCGCDHANDSVVINEGGFVEEVLNPEHMLKMYEKLQLHQEYPSMYEMVKWMTTESKRSGDSGLTFQSFVQ